MSMLSRWSQGVWRQEPFRWLLAVLVSAALGIAAGHTVIGAVSGSVSVVSGTSMEPAYQPGERVYTAPITTDLTRGDVVLVNDGNKEYALKRIVGLPGETIDLWRGHVFINQVMLREPYLPKHTYTFPDERVETRVFQLNSDQYFLLGDNRPCSSDSRCYGPVTRKQIISRVPALDNELRPGFAPYTLPAAGKRTIQPLCRNRDSGPNS